MKQPAGHRIVDRRNAIYALAGEFVAAKLELLFAVVHEVADEEVEPSVVVVVEPDRAGRPTRGGDTSVRCHVCERAITVVVIENAARILCYKQIRKAIAVVVTDGDSHPVSTPGHSRFQSHIGECPVTI